MEAQDYLANYKKKFDPVCKAYLGEKVKQAKKIDKLAEQALKMIKNFVLAGGKRLRPAILYYSYLGNGGKKEEEIIKASVSAELAHIFLLIHDDIIDKDEIRHGVSTIHERYKKIGKQILVGKNLKNKDVVHFSNSMAILVGDVAASMANEVIFNANFPAEKIIAALNKLQNIVYQTVPGEMIDVMMEFKNEATEEEIIRMHEGKTARYTFEGPIHLGYIFSDGEKDDENLEFFSRYAILAGKAFQLRDDILGVFGEEKKLGKPVGSDIIEGKQTLLILKAKEKANRQQLKFLENKIGNQDLNSQELEEIRKIIKETGSLGYSQSLARNMGIEAKEFLAKVKFKNNQAFDFFQALTDFIIKRQV